MVKAKFTRPVNAMPMSTTDNNVNDPVSPTRSLKVALVSALTLAKTPRRKAEKRSTKCTSCSDEGQSIRHRCTLNRRMNVKPRRICNYGVHFCGRPQAECEGAAVKAELRERLLKSKAVPEAETLHVSWLNGQKSESFGWMGEWSEHQNMKRFTRDSLGCQESHLQFCLESSSL